MVLTNGLLCLMGRECRGCFLNLTFKTPPRTKLSASKFISRIKNYNKILPREHFSDVFVDVLSC